MKKNVRWIQRLEKYCSALDILKNDMEDVSEQDFTDRDKRGVIKSFEFVQELAWKTLKDFLESVGESGIMGSKDAFNIAFQRELISDGILTKTIDSRNETAHTYDIETANKIFYAIKNEYYDAFERLRETLLEEKKKREL